MSRSLRQYRLRDEQHVRRPLGQASHVPRKPLFAVADEDAGAIVLSRQSRLLGTLFDGIARHTQEGVDFVARARAVGFREAVRERDDPFGDYGSRKR